jgi:hypothetical protein
VVIDLYGSMWHSRFCTKSSEHTRLINSGTDDEDKVCLSRNLLLNLQLVAPGYFVLEMDLSLPLLRDPCQSSANWPMIRRSVVKGREDLQGLLKCHTVYHLEFRQVLSFFALAAWLRSCSGGVPRLVGLPAICWDAAPGRCTGVGRRRGHESNCGAAR